ncbi:hypothetical protein AAF712_004226 [Marasmius tenuissimus]|uniref:Uncharacterized protein n=1 Tax=Marasmius tenuissimus TaxID=585030 RepID=A0ABR3A4J2_9AGAR
MSLSDLAVRDDIERYLRKNFERLWEEHKGTLPVSWPGNDVIMILADRSTGQFIYVTTIKFLSTGKVPVTRQQRLEVVLDAEPVLSSSSPYPDLDQLYSQILHFCRNDGRKLKRVLQLIISPVNLVLPETFPLPESLRMEPRSAVTIEQLLDRAQGLSVLHASFTNFLLDRNRSDDYYVGEKLGERVWKEILMVYQVRWLSRLSARHRSTPSLKGVYDHDLGSINFNFWEYLHHNLCCNTIDVTDALAEALNDFEPHLYLEMILGWDYPYRNSLLFEASPEHRHDYQDQGGKYHIAGVKD